MSLSGNPPPVRDPPPVTAPASLPSPCRNPGTAGDTVGICPCCPHSPSPAPLQPQDVLPTPPAPCSHPQPRSGSGHRSRFHFPEWNQPLEHLPRSGRVLRQLQMPGVTLGVTLGVTAGVTPEVAQLLLAFTWQGTGEMPRPRGSGLFSTALRVPSSDLELFVCAVRSPSCAAPPRALADPGSSDPSPSTSVLRATEPLKGFGGRSWAGCSIPGWQDERERPRVAPGEVQMS